MSDGKSKYNFGPEPGKAAIEMLDKMGLSPKQVAVLKVAAEGLAKVGKDCGIIAAFLGISPQESIHAFKAALAAYLAALESAPNLDNLESIR